MPTLASPTEEAAEPSVHPPEGTCWVCSAAMPVCTRAVVPVEPAELRVEPNTWKKPA